MHWLERRRNGSTRDDGPRCRAFRYYEGTARQDVSRDDVHREYCILQVAVAEIVVNELAQRIRRDQEVSPIQEAQYRPPRQWKNVTPAQSAPDRVQSLNPFNRWIARIVGTIQRASA